MRWPGHVTGIGQTRNAYKILARKSENKRSLDRHSSRWMILRWMLKWNANWVHLTQDRFLVAVCC